MFQKGETAPQTGCLKREVQKMTAIQDLVFVIAGMFCHINPNETFLALIEQMCLLNVFKTK